MCVCMDNYTEWLFLRTVYKMNMVRIKLNRVFYLRKRLCMQLKMFLLTEENALGKQQLTPSDY